MFGLCFATVSYSNLNKHTPQNRHAIVGRISGVIPNPLGGGTGGRGRVEPKKENDRGGLCFRRIGFDLVSIFAVLKISNNYDDDDYDHEYIPTRLKKTKKKNLKTISDGL